jgi:acyl-CoA thioester hydrolase
MYQEITRNDEVIFKATFRLAFLKNFKPSKIPLEFFDLFE